MTQALVLAAGAVEEHRTVLPMEPYMFGVVALITFTALLGLTWSFRSNANKHR